MKKEIRVSEFVNASEDEMILSGYALKFNIPTVLYRINNVDYKEVIARTALNGTDMSNCCMRYNHSMEYPILARVKNGSLTLTVDDVGLFFRAKLSNTQANKDIYEMVKDGILDKCSFAFNIAEGGEEYRENTRIITKIETLYDTSVVDVPAYDDTFVVARSQFKALDERSKLLQKLIIQTYL